MSYRVEIPNVLQIPTPSELLILRCLSLTGTMNPVVLSSVLAVGNQLQGPVSQIKHTVSNDITRKYKGNVLYRYSSSQIICYM